MSLPYLHPYLGLSNGLNTLHAAGGGGPGGPTGGWKELGRTTLGGTSDTITVSSLANKRYYMVLTDLNNQTHDITHYHRVGAGSVDTGTNYACRFYDPALGSDTTYTNIAGVYPFSGAGNVNQTGFNVTYWANYASKEKLCINHWVTNGSGLGAANAPYRVENVGKWANTSNPIDTINSTNTGSGGWGSGCEIVVLGWDPADDDTNGFWQELASVDLSGGAADDLDCTFTAKKYLWIQIYLDDSGAIDPELTFNNDGGSNYATRFSSNGGADGTATSQTKVVIGGNGAFPRFINLFVINNQSNEKLVIGHGVNLDGGAGAANAPYRIERAFKWANTSNQINDIDITNVGAGSFGTNSIIKVWGAD